MKPDPKVGPELESLPQRDNKVRRGCKEKFAYTFSASCTHTKCMDRQLANVRQEYELKINVSSYIKHALK